MYLITRYLILGIFVFGMNIVPAFMPPTWMVLAFYFLRFKLALIPVVIIGATAATLGRIVLYFLARDYFRRFLSQKTQENFDVLGGFIQSHKKLTFPLMFTYAFLPIPSNQAFIAAGLAEIDIKIFALSFFLGRLISYTFWITSTVKVTRSLEGIFSRSLGNWGTLVGELLSFSVIIILSRINWKKVLYKNRLPPNLPPKNPNKPSKKGK